MSVASRSGSPGVGENGALDAVTKFADVIDTIARQLENAITWTEDAVELDTEPVAL